MNDELTKANIQEIWQRIVAKLDAVGAKNQFNPAATPTQLQKLETELGTELPIALVSLLECQNGSVDYFDQIIVDSPFFSTSQIASEWRTNCDVDEDSNAEIPPGGDLSDFWWHRRCIPVCGANGSGVCIDSVSHQMYSYSSGMFGIDGPIAPSLVEWIGRIADRLDADEYQFEDSKVSVEFHG